MTNSEHKQYLKNFMQQLHEERFYDAHESLEAIWFPKRFEECDETRLIKGFINAAVCFELIKKGKIDASHRVWKTYLKYEPLLHKVNSEHLSDYQTIALHVQKIKSKLDINPTSV